MSNYLKKLAYIKRELVKLAAPVVDDFTELPNLYEQDIINEFTNMVTDSSQSPSVLTPESRAALGIPDLEYMEHPVPRPIPVSTLPTKSDVPSDQMHSVLETPDVNPYNLQTPQTKAPPRSIITSPGESQDPAPRPVTYNNAQLQRVRDYQNALIAGMMYRDGLTRDQAIQKLKDNGRWYKINKDRTITVNMGPKSQPGRFLDIINGKRTAQDIKWRGGVDPYSDMATPAPGSPRAQSMVSQPAAVNTMTSKPQRPKSKKQSQPAAAPVSTAPAVQTPTAQANPPAQISQGFQRVPGRPFLNVRNRFRANRGLPPIR